MKRTWPVDLIAVAKMGSLRVVKEVLSQHDNIKKVKKIVARWLRA